MRMAVDTGGYVSACSDFYSTNHSVVSIMQRLMDPLYAGGGMAGTDTGGEEFAAKYDAAAGPLVTAGCGLAEAMGKMANLLNASLANHQGADYGARIYGPPSGATSDGDDNPEHYSESLSVTSPPSAKGGTGDTPGWWHWVASHVEGLLWPDADTGKLRSVGNAWVTAGQSLRGSTYAIDAASAQVGAQTSPEVHDVVSSCHSLKGHVTDLAGAFEGIGHACKDYADQVDKHHEEVEHELTSFLEWTAGIEIGGAILGAVTLGAGEGAAQVAEGAEVANAASKVARILRDLIEFARLGVARIGEVARTAGEIGPKIRRILSAREIRAVEEVGGDLAKVDLKTLPKWADGGKIPKTGPDAAMYEGGVERYGGMSRQEFFDKYWDAEKGEWKYPPHEGFEGTPVPNTIQRGDIIDRIGGPNGKFASPADTPYGERAIPPSSIGREYHQYEVVKHPPESVTQGKTAPWFEQSGGGTQYVFDRPIDWYVRNGYLKEVG